MPKHRRLWDIYRFPRFHPSNTVLGIFGDPKARVIRLIRRGKKQFVEPAALSIIPSTTGRFAGYETSPAGICASIWRWKFGVSFAGDARK
jgi:hypothetical protein